MPAMITAIVIGCAVLWAIVRACRRWEFKRVMEFLGMILLVLPAFAFGTVILSSVFHGVSAPSMTTRIMVGLIVGVVACLIARKFGWVNLLGWTFSAAMALCGLVIGAFVLFAMFAMANGAH